MDKSKKKEKKALKEYETGYDSNKRRNFAA